jgi:NAD(P)-dependent dehydrogenase (short-subunit alcohol dehydrogenase family)
VFRGRNVVVTGAAGALGAAVTRLLVSRGATCHLPLHATPLGDPGAGSVRITSGVDLSDERAVERFYAGLPELWASVHCVGGFTLAPLGETTLADLSHMLAINLAPTFLCCREAARVMRAGKGGGRIVNVAARPALEPRAGAGMAAYAASKAAVAAFTVALAEELAPEGIWVNAVAPSILDTPANRAAMPDADASRWPRPEDVAETIAHLASPANAATRGAIIPVYGRS